MKQDLINRLRKLDLQNGFPYEDLNLIEDTYVKEQSNLPNDTSLIEDFNDFCFIIAGSVSYAMEGKKIPQYQKRLLNKDFFENYPSYFFLKKELNKYSDLKGELEIHELARQLLIKL
ncbi:MULTISPECIES: YxiJ family protein [Clostridia]|uniref:YxiJ family protein n=1 Tax=Clostridia TaxID=186801 RepID=UPI000EA022DF|nr:MULTISPECIES: YxiJ family protein [Clostridia]NBJ71526.1 hypothetical protein [Roseburia sp. 1XD42-34]RKI74276.1 hypothetical protein D7V87_19090 [Clostridium sp. 1xD42-85]